MLKDCCLQLKKKTAENERLMIYYFHCSLYLVFCTDRKILKQVVGKCKRCGMGRDHPTQGSRPK